MALMAGTLVVPVMLSYLLFQKAFVPGLLGRQQTKELIQKLPGAHVDHSSLKHKSIAQARHVALEHSQASHFCNLAKPLQ